MPARFQVYKDVKGNFRFRLFAENNKIVAVSQAYQQHLNCIKGITSVKNNCNSEIEDTTIEGTRPILSNPKYQVFCDEKNKFRFHLNASNGEIIAASEGYETKEGCIGGILAVKKSCNAKIEDLTTGEEPISPPTGIKLPEPKEIKLPEPKEAKVIAAAVSQDKVLPNSPKPKTVFVGNKPPMDYVLAIITGFSSSDVKELTLKARGKAITTAVDAAEITRNRFLKDLKVSKIGIGTEEMPAREGENRARMVSIIEITLTQTVGRLAELNLFFSVLQGLFEVEL